MLKPIPISSEETTNHRALPVCAERIMKNAANSNASDSNESGSLRLSITTLAGTIDRIKAADIAAMRPKAGLIAM